MAVTEAVWKAASITGIITSADKLISSLKVFGSELEATTKDNFGSKKIKLNAMVDLYVEFVRSIREAQKTGKIPVNSFEDIKLEADQVYFGKEVKARIKELTDFKVIQPLGQQVLDGMERGLREIQNELKVVLKRVA
ncbi:hypothetical protein HYX14_00405 [Candidatus Woesearchaeota archaeon]|nr:hypothetical protein [Candidatus Woesearchaeota archaeon]